MRLAVFFILISLFVVACSSNDEGAEYKERPLWSRTDTIILWSSDAELSIRKRLFVPEDSINIAEPILNGINELWPEAGIFLKGQKNDTLLVGLQNENWLTNEIGNEGAESFLSFAAMNLLELKGINHIYFDLTPGVHAGAETWEDTDFADWKTGK